MNLMASAYSFKSDLWYTSSEENFKEGEIYVDC